MSIPVYSDVEINGNVQLSTESKIQFGQYVTIDQKQLQFSSATTEQIDIGGYGKVVISGYQCPIKLYSDGLQINSNTNYNLPQSNSINIQDNSTQPINIRASGININSYITHEITTPQIFTCISATPDGSKYAEVHWDEWWSDIGADDTVYPGYPMRLKLIKDGATYTLYAQSLINMGIHITEITIPRQTVKVNVYVPPLTDYDTWTHVFTKSITSGYALNAIKYSITNTVNIQTPQFLIYSGNIQIKDTGEIVASAFTQASDIRLKTNIVNYSSHNSILSLPIYEFDYINSNMHTIGCTAQDLQQICPEIVSAEPNGYLTIQESKIVYLLLDEMKKMRQELDELKQNK